MALLLPTRRFLLNAPWLKNELWRRARAVPSLDLRFAENRSLVDATTGLDLVTFSRTSDGTATNSSGNLIVVPANTPRFDHNPITGESLGLLVEEQRTNLLLQSEDFGTTWIRLDGLQLSTNQIVAPNGSTTADLLTGNGLQTGYIEQPTTSSNQFTNGIVYTFSIYLKKANTSTAFTLLYGTTFNSGGSNPVATWNLDTGIPSFSNGATGSMTPVGNGWYRCVLTDTATATETRNQQWLRMPSSSGDVYAWGAQLEVGAFPTSYIPTGASAVTRAADVCLISGSNFSSWYRQDEETVFWEGTVNATSGLDRRLFNVSDATSFVSNGSSLFVSNSAQRAASFNNFVSSTNIGPIHGSVAHVAGANRKAAYSIAANSRVLAINGDTPIVSTSSFAPPSNIVTAFIGQSGGGESINGHIRRLTYWPQRLPNAVLQTITL